MSASPARLCFPPFVLDLATGTLENGSHATRLKPQATAVLRYLVEHAGQVVRQDELLAALWPDVRVGTGVLKTLIWEIRQALGDQPQAPRFIETLPRRGYRFIGLLGGEGQAESSALPSGASTPSPLLTEAHRGLAGLVGREAELAWLHERLRRALAGERQIVFVTGEAGIGKTALVTAFLRQIAQHADIWIARGQCIEHYGSGEAYLPVLDALSRLGREAGRRRLARLLRQHAPTWLAQLPALVSAPERDKVHRATVGVTRERMLRELAEAVEVLTAQVGLVLWVEDMQWSDPSTLEWVGYMARRAGPARLLVVGTCRPVALLEPGHPLRARTQELLLYGQAVELELRGLTLSAVSDYLCQHIQYEERGACHTLARAMHQRTEGHPLFMVNVIEYLCARGALTPSHGLLDLQGALALIQQEVPPRLQQLIERQLAQLPPEEQRLLEVASVAGNEFSTPVVADGLAISLEEAEERCAALARRALFVQPCGRTNWPDGTMATRYAFRHALYTSGLYERLPASRCRAIHERLGRRLEQAYGGRAREVATELALHYERGQQYGRAVHYLRLAGENASRRSAHPEAISLLRKGLDLLQTLSETAERRQQELRLLFALGASLIVVKGYAAPEVEDVYTRAYALCQQSSDTRQRFAALLGLSGMYHNRAEYRKVRDLTEQMRGIAQEAGSATYQLWAYVLLGQVCYQTGEFTRAQQHYLQSLGLYDQRRHSPHVSDITQDPRAHCLANLAEALWLCGYPDQALQHSQEALAWARRLGHPHSLVVVLSSVALVHGWRGEFCAAGELAEEHIAVASAHGFPFWLAVGTIRQGWAMVAQGHPEVGVTLMRQGWAALQATGTKLALAGLLSEFAWALGAAGEVEAGLALIAEALTKVHNTGEYLHAAELYRLKGTLLHQSSIRRPASTISPPDSGSQPPDAKAEEYFQQAIQIARRQCAKSLELRATVSLGRLWQQQGKYYQARHMLAPVYGWFTEGLATADLQDAKALLDVLS